MGMYVVVYITGDYTGLAEVKLIHPAISLLFIDINYPPTFVY